MPAGAAAPCTIPHRTIRFSARDHALWFCISLFACDIYARPRTQRGPPTTGCHTHSTHISVTAGHQPNSGSAVSRQRPCPARDTVRSLGVSPHFAQRHRVPRKQDEDSRQP
eukprot:7324277-Prymnesium_polylepis.1